MTSIFNANRIGVVSDTEERRFVESLFRIGFVSWSETPFTLKSGGKSHVYVNGRSELTREPETLAFVGLAIGKTVEALLRDYVRSSGKRDRFPCLIGIPTAGTALAFAAGQHPQTQMAVSIMREKPKNYGNSSGWVEGAPDPSHLYMTIDNVVTDGTSKLEAIERLAADGYPVDEITHIILVDRGQGAVESLRAAGHRVEVIFHLIDIVRAFNTYGFWTSAQVAAVEEELAQFAA